jgi:hypothetical protein
MIPKELIEDMTAAGIHVQWGVDHSYVSHEQLAKFAELQRQRERQAVPSGINFGAIVDALEAISNDIRPEVEHLSKLIYAYADQITAAQSRHEAEREALVRKCARYEELIREVIATDEAAVKELEAMNLGGVAEPTLTAKLRHALFDSGSQG